MSEWYQIESSHIIVQLVTRGAEMKRLFNKSWNKELLWNGEDKIWERSAPVLFPIVGKLKDDEYIYEGKTYSLPRHGFARDQEFVCTICDPDEAEFYLGTTKESYKIYPFIFELRINYKIEENVLRITHKVKNIDQKTMYFSIGSHPGFETKTCTNFEIVFEKDEAEYLVLENDLINLNRKQNFRVNRLAIEKSVFRKDALIFPTIKSHYVDLVDKKFKRIIRLKNVKDNYLGVWSKGEVPFVCLEPWQGIADLEDHDKELVNKKGILKLAPGKEHTFKYEIELLSFV